MKLKRKNLALVTAALAVTSVAVAATLITVQTPFKLSDGLAGDKPKLQRMGDGTLVTVWGDSPDGAGTVYDVKADAERPARDVFSKFCKPDDTKTCNELGDWSPAVNISNSALQTSTGLFDWQGTSTPTTYPGDIDKANIKTNGSVIVVTWVSKYCPDGDLGTAGVQPSVQRGVKYLERASRVIPFSCTWMAYSTNKGQSWRPAKQLSTGERDAIQDSSGGTFDSVTKKGKINVSWQEDPAGLKLGGADGPGDGASGASVHGGTDVWYAYADVDLNQLAPTSGNEYSTAYFNLQPAVRLTDNWLGLYGYFDDTTIQIVDGAGTVLDGTSVGQKVESGTTGASRPNIGMVGSNAIVAYEESKGSVGVDDGKFVRYHAFPYNNPPQDTTSNPVPGAVIGTPGCVISNPTKNGRRVRFLTQSPTDAGTGGMQLAIFWKEGEFDGGGPSDIVARRGMGGVLPANMVPAVDAACETSSYATAMGLLSDDAANISSNTPTATTANLTDNTEANATENALAHRGVLRGTDLWIGYSYTGDLVKLAAQQDNYNFWTRKFTWDGVSNVSGTWESPKNVSNITNKTINVREPRFFGTPKSNTDAGYCDNADPTLATDPTFCQDTQVVYAAWGTQTNVADPEDLGEYVTVSLDGATTFSAPVKMSVAQGVLWGDDESAFEAQPVTRPDGTRFYAVWNQKDLTTSNTYAEYTSGDVSVVPDPVPTPSSSSGGCTLVQGEAPFDPTLPALAALGLIGLGLRRARRH